MDKVDVYILNIELVKDSFNFVTNYIEPTRRSKALKFVQEKDQLLSLGAGYLLKKYLPSTKIKESKSGKPYLENGPFFNISHSGEYVVLAIGKNWEVGVDIERVDESKLDAIKFSLQGKEKDVFDINSLFLMWSNKESLIKCLSLGVQDIKIVSGLPLEGVRTFNESEYFTKSQIYNNYSLSVTLKGNEPFNINIKPITDLEE